MKRAPMKRRYVDTGPSAATEALVRLRSSDRCELCGLAGSQTHHRQPRGLGSSRDPRVNLCSNLLRLCTECHEYVERNRAEALIAGWLVSRYSDPAKVAVLIQRGSKYVYLGNDGSYHDNPPEAVAS